MKRLVKEVTTEIDNFINNILIKYNFKDTNLKTTNFSAKKENKYNGEIKTMNLISIHILKMQK